MDLSFHDPPKEASTVCKGQAGREAKEPFKKHGASEGATTHETGTYFYFRFYVRMAGSSVSPSLQLPSIPNLFYWLFLRSCTLES